MKQLLAILWLISSNLLFAQPDSVRFYTLDEVRNASPDTIFAISLRKSKLTEIPTELLRFKHLRYLDLEKNNINNVLTLGEFKELVYLNLSRNDLQYFPVSVCQMAEIEELVLNRNSFETVPPCISYCTKLRKIDFWETPVRSLPAEMQSLKNLEIIDFTGVKMNPTGQKKLKEQFPNVELKLDSPCDCMY